MDTEPFTKHCSLISSDEDEPGGPDSSYYGCSTTAAAHLPSSSAPLLAAPPNPRIAIARQRLMSAPGPPPGGGAANGGALGDFWGAGHGGEEPDGPLLHRPLHHLAPRSFMSSSHVVVGPDGGHANGGWGPGRGIPSSASVLTPTGSVPTPNRHSSELLWRSASGLCSPSGGTAGGAARAGSLPASRAAGLYAPNKPPSHNSMDSDVTSITPRAMMAARAASMLVRFRVRFCVVIVTGQCGSCVRAWACAGACGWVGAPCHAAAPCTPRCAPVWH